MNGQPTRRSGAGIIWSRLRRPLRAVVQLLYGVVAATGAVFSPAPSLGLGVLFAVLAWAIMALLHKCPADDLLPLAHPLVAAAQIACLPAAVAGLSALGADTGLVVGLGLLLATMLAGYWLTPPPARPPSPATRAPEPPGDERSLRDLLRDLPSDLIFDEWRSTQLHEVLGGGEASVDVRVRDLLIDEMRRRDPAGTRQWLDQHPEDPPDRYVGRPPG